MTPVGELITSIKACLDLSQDRMIVESGSRWSINMSQAGRGIRRDGYHRHAFRRQGPGLQEAKLILVAPQTALATACGMAASLREGHGDGWVVVLVDADSLAQQLSADPVGRFQSASGRVCLVVIDSPETVERKLSLDLDLHDGRAHLWPQLETRGFRYIGPIDPGETQELTTELARVRTLGGPAVVHVRAVGGVEAQHTGRPTLDRSADIPPRDSAPMRYVDVARAELLRLADHNPRIRIVDMASAAAEGAVVSDSGPRFLRRNAAPEQVLTWCAGLATGGGHPVLLVTSSHLPGCLEALAEDFATPGLGVTVLVCDEPQSTPVGRANGSVNAIDSIAPSRELAHTLVMAPKDGGELRQMLRLSIRMNGPSVIHVPDAIVTDGGSPAIGIFQPGAAEWLIAGRSGVVLAAGPAISAASAAVEIMQADGLDVGLVNLRFLSPLDTGLIDEAARRTDWISVIEDGPFQTGLGEALMQSLRSRGIEVPIYVWESPRGNAPDGTPPRQAMVDELRGHLAALASKTPHADEPLPEILAEPLGMALGRFSISEDLLQSERMLVQRTVLSPEIDRWVEAYEKVGHRTRFLWQWCQHGLQLTTLPCVPDELVPDVCDTKLLAVMVGVLLDDVADRQEDRHFLDELETVVTGYRPADFRGFTPDQRLYGEFTRDLWNAFQERTSRYPYYEVYCELLRYDNQQILNTMRYSLLINQNLNLLNTIEHDLYLPHNMQMMSFATIDCMCSPGFDCSELGKVREAIWHAQCMGRIGNLVSTWQREINDGDFSSGVFARALIRGELTLQQLQARDRSTIEAAILSGNHEGYFLERWEHHRNRLQAMRPHIRSFDLGRLIDGLDRLLHMELGSRGLK